MLTYAYFMKAKKILFTIALCFSFAALGNAAILEPLRDVKSPKVFSHSAEKDSDESQCCFICHPAHHQWMANATVNSPHRLTCASSFQHQTVHFHPDPPIGSIFRPPLAF